MSSPTLAETIDVLRAIVNRWSGDYHCCADNKHGATHSPGCPLVAGLLLLARVDPGQSGHTISRAEEREALILGDLLDAPGPVRPLPDKSGYSCHWFTRRDRDYYCDQGEGHQGPHHNANVPDAAAWVDRPPDGVWLDSDGIPGPTRPPSLPRVDGAELVTSSHGSIGLCCAKVIEVLIDGAALKTNCPEHGRREWSAGAWLAR